VFYLCYVRSQKEFEPFVVDREWLAYPNTPVAGETASTHRAKIVVQAKLVATIKTRISANMSIQKSALETSFQMIGATRAKKWKCTDDAIKKWAVEQVGQSSHFVRACQQTDVEKEVADVAGRGSGGLLGQEKIRC
jgi:hypothetical protein